jgi:pimeloyl-ACP methyl ester carboxylesterase
VLRALADGTIFGETYGDGEPAVVWLHGWARRGSDFAAAANELAASGVSSIALDLPGFGSSPAPHQAGGARSYAPIVAATMNEIASQPVTLVGHSFGGRVAICVAASHPELVNAVVLTGVPLLRSAPSRTKTSYRLIRWGARHRLVRAATLENARHRFGSEDYRNARGVMRDVLVACVAESYDEELAAWRGPTALVWGRNDTTAPSAVAERASVILPTHPVVELVDGGHFLPTEHPDVLVAAVRRFVS